MLVGISRLYADQASTNGCATDENSQQGRRVPKKAVIPTLKHVGHASLEAVGEGMFRRSG